MSDGLIASGRWNSYMNDTAENHKSGATRRGLTAEERLEQRRDSAKKYASQVRSRKPEMQVKRLEK
jgi:hypothetical protein